MMLKIAFLNAIVKSKGYQPKMSHLVKIKVATRGETII